MEHIIKLHEGDEYGNSVYGRLNDVDTDVRISVEYNEDEHEVILRAWHSDVDHNPEQVYRNEKGEMSGHICLGLTLHTINELIDALTYSRDQLIEHNK